MCFIYKSNEQAKKEREVTIDMICHHINDADQISSAKTKKLSKL